MSARTDLIARLPWVTRLEIPQSCDGYRYSHMPGKALRDPAIMATYKCKNQAYWTFRALKRGPMPAHDGTYCWSHLMTQLFHYPAEEIRTKRKLTELRQP